MTNRVWNSARPAVPVDSKGNWLGYGQDWRVAGWREILQPFYAVMTIEDIYSGRSAKGIVLSDENGTRYPMFIKDFVELAKNGTVSEGKIAGFWTGSKRGNNYGIKFVRESNEV